MNVLSKERRMAVVGALVEGNSIPATVRMTGASKNVVRHLIAALEPAYGEYQNRVSTGSLLTAGHTEWVCPAQQRPTWGQRRKYGISKSNTKSIY
jgi:transposase